jgi:hypothetical protein
MGRKRAAQDNRRKVVKRAEECEEGSRARGKERVGAGQGEAVSRERGAEQGEWCLGGEEKRKQTP